MTNHYKDQRAKNDENLKEEVPMPSPQVIRNIKSFSRSLRVEKSKLLGTLIHQAN